MIRSVVLAASDSSLAEPLAQALRPSTRVHFVKIMAEEQPPSGHVLPADASVVLIQPGSMDVQEPWFRGLINCGIPVVAILSDPNDRERMYHAGVQDYVLEPLVVSEVQARLDPYLQGIKSDQKGATGMSLVDARLERLDQQLIQNERWIAMGRVVAAVCHDITNRMQAAHGALTLATEESSVSADMQAYLDLAMQETRRVTAYVQRLRRVYHPEMDTLETINVHELLSGVKDLACDASAGGVVKLETAVAADLPPLQCKAGQLEFILLGILLNLMDLISGDSSARARIEASSSGSTIRFEISTDSRLADWVQARKDQQTLEHALGLPSFRALVAAQNGKLGFCLGDSGLRIWISLPTLAAIP